MDHSSMSLPLLKRRKLCDVRYIFGNIASIGMSVRVQSLMGSVVEGGDLALGLPPLPSDTYPLD